MSDASYRDAAFTDQPLRLVAQTADDLGVVSALAQDAVGRAGEVSWMPRRRRLAILLNRFRWEDQPAAEREGRPYERVRAALLFDSVLAVRARGVEPSQRQAPMSLLRIDWQPDDVEGGGEPGGEGAGETGGAAGPGGRILLALGGGGELVLEVECIDARLIDLSRPWEARAQRAPDHPVDDRG